MLWDHTVSYSCSLTIATKSDGSGNIKLSASILKCFSKLEI